MRNLCLLRFGWLVLLGGMGRVAAAQDAPVYPPPAPLDTAGLAHSPDAKTFANSQVVGMGPSKGLIVKYERLPDFNIRSTAKAAGLSDYNSQVRTNKTLLIKGYVPLLNHPPSSWCWASTTSGRNTILRRSRPTSCTKTLRAKA